MRLVILANELLKEELLAQGIKQDVEAAWANTPEDLLNHGEADACIDLLFENNPARVELLQQVRSKIIIVNDVAVIKAVPSNFIRINGWATCLKRIVTEAYCKDESIKANAENILSGFNKKTEWLPATPGFITARVVAMIINEAYFSLEEQVSTKEEIDIAMKLGTNYPYGPFEWSQQIGLKNVYALLLVLAQSNPRYEPSILLKKEALAA